MKELPYFRFTGSEWSNGDISLESDSVKGFFMDVLVYYWSQNCNISVTKMNKKFPRKTKKITLLVKTGIIKVENDLVSIEFLDQQLAEIAQKTKSLSEAGKKGAEARELKRLATLKPPLSNKDKDKDKDKEKSRAKRFAPPSPQEITKYCIESGHSVDSQRFVDYYASNGWKVGKNSMKDWKATVRTWSSKDKPSPPPKDSKATALELREIKRREDYAKRDAELKAERDSENDDDGYKTFDDLPWKQFAKGVK